MNRTVKKRSNCPIGYALDIFGDKWSLLIVRDIMFKGKSQYGQFLQSEEKIATNILADRLERLEAQGVLSKMQDPSNLTKFQYRLTEKGLDLLPVLLELIAWSAKYDHETAASKRFVEAVKRDRDKVISEIRALQKLS